MKKMLLLAATAFTAVTMSAQSLPASEVPAGVNVLPVPNSIIDTSVNQYPLGASAISINFSGKDVAVNPDQTQPAELYWNDFTTPVATTLRRSVDAMNQIDASVLFSETYTLDGQYKVVIPEGMFYYITSWTSDGEPVLGEKTPGMTLYYEISLGYVVTPANNACVSEMEEIVLSFPEASEVTVGELFSSDAQFYLNPSGVNIPMHWVVDGNRLVGTFEEDGGIRYNFQTPGRYMLFVPANAISYVVNGQTKYNSEIRLEYYIQSSPEPEIWPYCDQVVTDGFEYFELTLPQGFEVMMKNDKLSNYIYYVNENGNMDRTKPVAIAKLIFGESKDQYLYLGLFDPDTLEPLNFEWDKHDNEFQTYAWTVKAGSLKPWKPAKSGEYCLELTVGLYFGSYQPIVEGAVKVENINNDPFQYFYNVVGEQSAVEEVETAAPAENVDVYNFGGVCVAKNAPASVVNSLPAGFYIVNGKKIVVK